VFGHLLVSLGNGCTTLFDSFLDGIHALIVVDVSADLHVDILLCEQCLEYVDSVLFIVAKSFVQFRFIDALEGSVTSDEDPGSHSSVCDCLLKVFFEPLQLISKTGY
jgi:hypothetical protein